MWCTNLEVAMPIVIRLGDIKIVIYADDHNFHIITAVYKASVELETLAIVAGFVPRQVYEVATAWALDHMSLLRDTWAKLNDRN